MDLTLLREPHSIRDGDTVVVVERTDPEKKYYGKVYKIVNLPINKHIMDLKNIMVDYFYIQFSEEITSILLKRGLPIIYKHSPATLGNIIRNRAGQIEKIYIQYNHSSYETEISFNDINALLMWRVAYDITQMNI